MKRLLVFITIFILMISSNGYCGYSYRDMPLNHVTYLVNCCKNYNIDIETAVAILFIENPYLNNNIVNKNNDGTYDYGYFQINTVNVKGLLRVTKTKDIQDPYDNILCGVYLMYSNKNKLNTYGISVNPFTSAFMHHRPGEIVKFKNNKSFNAIGYKYSVKAYVIYSYIKKLRKENSSNDPIDIYTLIMQVQNIMKGG